MPQKSTFKKTVNDDPRYAQAVQNYEAGLRAMQEHKFDRAKGLLQVSYQWTEEEAYLHLRRTSRQRRQPMREIAREIIDLAGSTAGGAQ